MVVLSNLVGPPSRRSTIGIFPSFSTAESSIARPRCVRFGQERSFRECLLRANSGRSAKRLLGKQLGELGVTLCAEASWRRGGPEHTPSPPSRAHSRLTRARRSSFYLEHLTGKALAELSFGRARIGQPGREPRTL